MKGGPEPSKQIMMMIAFITIKSSLVPLIEGIQKILFPTGQVHF